jgi:dihydrofolate reductase
MRKIVGNLMISLDGVVESPEQWHFQYFNDEMGAIIGEGSAAADTMLLGRRTYEEFAAFWPTQGGDNPMAAQMNGMPKLVASTTLERAKWQNSAIIAGDVAAVLTRLKGGTGRQINIVGSGTLVASLLRAGVLDELALFLHPIVVGRGKKLFDDDGPQVPLTLASSKALGTGVLLLRYVPVREG